MSNSSAWKGMVEARQAPAVLNQVRPAAGGIRGGRSYSLLDNSFDADFSRQAGIPVFLENAVMVCNHCGVNVIVNPDRTRPREFCFHCAAYVCDSCKAQLIITGVCTSQEESIELLLTHGNTVTPFNIRKSQADLDLRRSKKIY